MTVRFAVTLLAVVAPVVGAAVVPEFRVLVSASAKDFARQDITVQIGVLSSLVGVFGFSGILLSLPVLGSAARLKREHDGLLTQALLVRQKIEKAREDLAHVASRSPAEALARGEVPDATAASRLRTSNLDPLISAAEGYVQLVLKGETTLTLLSTARACADMVGKLAARTPQREALERKLHDAEHASGLRADAPVTVIGRAEDAAAMLDILNAAAQERIKKGAYPEALRITERAVAHAIDNGLDVTLSGFAAHREHARALSFNARYRESLAELDDLLLLWAEVLAPRHRDVLVTRALRANILDSLARFQEALAERDQLLALMAEVLTAGDLDVLSLRLQRAQSLHRLGFYQDALDELDDLLRLQREVLDPLDHDILIARCQRAQELNRLGRHQEAFDELDDLLPVQEKVLKPDHPSVLSTRALRAQTLDLLGRHQDALDELEILLPLQKEVLRPLDNDALSTRFQHAWTLNALTRYPEALMAAQAVLGDMIAILPEGHPFINHAVSLVAGIRAAMVADPTSDQGKT